MFIGAVNLVKGDGSRHTHSPSLRGGFRVSTTSGPLHLPSPKLLFSMLANSDGVLIASPRVYEPQEMISSLEDWFAQDGRDFHLLGPMINPRKAVVAASDQSTEFDLFMTRVFKSHGSKSMLYVRTFYRLG